MLQPQQMTQMFFPAGVLTICEKEGKFKATGRLACTEQQNERKSE